MKMIVGLGNPGLEYEKTRHNIGFLFLDYLAKTFSTSFNKQKFNSHLAEFYFENEKVILLKPQTFMNLSGQSVEAALSFYKESLENILIVHDELDLPFYHVKLVKKAGAAGHRGVLSIQQMLSTQEIARLRLGIDKPKTAQNIADYVLENFSKLEFNQLESFFEDLLKSIKSFLKNDWVNAIQFANSIKKAS